ncbi:MAG TPA: hypothetical protein PKY27_05190 [Arachnia sp.]|nr:hypothetical protein [Propionibacteriaceae bacterium]HOA26828.1 hypothetical protein [Arachnia sp.]HQD21632.1 hypothetical protein [Arachnia sp.]
MSTQPPDFHQPHPTRSEPPQPRLQQGWSAPQAEPGTLNVLGILALGVQVVSALLTAVSPIFYRTADNIAAASTMFAIVSIGMLLLTIVLGLCALLQKRATRGRWTAIAALGSAGISLITMFGSAAANAMFIVIV